MDGGGEGGDGIGEWGGGAEAGGGAGEAGGGDGEKGEGACTKYIILYSQNDFIFQFYNFLKNDLVFLFRILFWKCVVY